MTETPRVLLVTDSDSYVKWGAALANQLPKDWTVHLVLARGNAEPSPRQLSEALDGTRFDADGVPRVGLRQLRSLLDEWRPDVLVAATRGPAVQAMVSLIPNASDRPVVVSGLAGISVPVIGYGLGFRRAVDVFVVHSRRELREFAQASIELGIPHTYGLATLPFLASAPRPAEPDSMRSVKVEVPVRNRIVFAGQAMVPASRRERLWLLRQLIETARAHPALEVVIKVRAREGEPQTHVEHYSYERLLVGLLSAGEHIPANLVVESGAMSRHLRRAVGLVTVSSTALLEAIDEGIPALALTDFGVGADQINIVLMGSGLLGTARDLVDAEFRHPEPSWLDDNYFHDSSANSWLARVEGLLALRRTTGMPPYPELKNTSMNRVRAMLLRKFAFVPEQGTRREVVESRLLAVGLWVNRHRGALGVTFLRRRAGYGRKSVTPSAGGTEVRCRWLRAPSLRSTRGRVFPWRPRRQRRTAP